MNNRQVAHAFAHGETRKNGSHFFIDGDTLYSYGRHFPVARHTLTADNSPCVLITTRGYSQSTSRHISYARQACSHLQTFDVHNVKAASKREHKENLTAMRADYEQQILAASRARSSAHWRLERASEQLEAANRYAAAFRLGARLKPANVEQLAERAKREQHKAETARKKAETEAREATRDRLARWSQGEQLFIGNHYGEPVRLRLVGDTVQTSHGAEFPAEDARRAWPLIQRCRNRNQGAEAQGDEPTRLHFGRFALDSVSNLGHVRAGCHIVTYEACRELAQILGLPL